MSFIAIRIRFGLAGPRMSMALVEHAENSKQVDFQARSTHGEAAAIFKNVNLRFSSQDFRRHRCQVFRTSFEEGTSPDSVDPELNAIPMPTEPSVSFHDILDDLRQHEVQKQTASTSLDDFIEKWGVSYPRVSYSFLGAEILESGDPEAFGEGLHVCECREKY
jgi:hypothetical protein